MCFCPSSHTSLSILKVQEESHSFELDMPAERLWLIFNKPLLFTIVARSPYSIIHQQYTGGAVFMCALVCVCVCVCVCHEMPWNVLQL